MTSGPFDTARFIILHSFSSLYGKKKRSIKSIHRKSNLRASKSLQAKRPNVYRTFPKSERLTIFGRVSRRSGLGNP